MKGSYILIIFIERDIQLEVGALGKIIFDKGYYFYVGSAMANYGSSTLLNRVKRHLLSNKKKSIHWHIDYFLAEINSLIIKICLIPSSEPLECTIAQELSKICDNSIKNFGSSDCKCQSHLFFFKNLKYFTKKFSDIEPNQNG